MLEIACISCGALQEISRIIGLPRSRANYLQPSTPSWLTKATAGNVQTTSRTKYLHQAGCVTTSNLDRWLNYITEGTKCIPQQVSLQEKGKMKRYSSFKKIWLQLYADCITAVVSSPLQFSRGNILTVTTYMYSIYNLLPMHVPFLLFSEVHKAYVFLSQPLSCLKGLLDHI